MYHFTLDGVDYTWAAAHVTGRQLLAAFGDKPLWWGVHREPVAADLTYWLDRTDYAAFYTTAKVRAVPVPRELLDELVAFLNRRFDQDRPLDKQLTLITALRGCLRDQVENPPIVLDSVKLFGYSLVELREIIAEHQARWKFDVVDRPRNEFVPRSDVHYGRIKPGLLYNELESAYLGFLVDGLCYRCDGRHEPNFCPKVTDVAWPKIGRSFALAELHPTGVEEFVAAVRQVRAKEMLP